MQIGGRANPMRSMRQVPWLRLEITLVVLGGLSLAWTWLQMARAGLIMPPYPGELVNPVVDSPGLTSLRWLVIPAAGLGLAGLMSRERRLRVLAVHGATVVLLIAEVMMNSRLSAIAAIFSAAAVLCLAHDEFPISWVRAVSAVVLLLVGLTAATTIRTQAVANQYGVTNPVAQAAASAQAYFAFPVQVTFAVGDQLADGTITPPDTPVYGVLAPLMPQYMRDRALGDPPAASVRAQPVFARYQNAVKLLPQRIYVLNGALVDTVMTVGWTSIPAMVLGYGCLAFLVGALMGGGAVGCALGGALLAAFSDQVRLYALPVGQYQTVIAMSIAVWVWSLRGDIAGWWRTHARKIGGAS